MQQKRKPFSRAIILLLITALLLICALAATYFTYYNKTAVKDNLFREFFDEPIVYTPGVRVDGIDLGDLTEQESRELVSAKSPKPLGFVNIKSGEKETRIDLSSLRPTRNFETALHDALSVGNGPPMERGGELTRLNAEGGQDFYSDLDYDLTPLRGEVERAAKDLSIDPIDASLKILSQEEKEKRLSNKSIPLSTSQDDANAVSIDDLVDFVDAIPGSAVDVDALFKLIQDELNKEKGDISKSIEIDGKPVPAEKNLDAVRENFVLVSSADSSFAKSNFSVPNRVFNLQKAADILNGYIIQPGEEFSCNEVFGPRSERTGWKAAGAISNGRSVQEVGGGICQVSSVLFNTILLADLEIVNRIPHSWPLSYITTGQDATISTGGPDFVFKNDRETPVVLLATIDTNKKELVIQLYGEPVADGMTIKLISEKTGNVPQPATQTTTDPGSVRSGRSGSTWKTYKEYYKGDTLVKRDFAYDTRYRAFSNLVLSGGGGSRKNNNAPVEQVQASEQEFVDVSSMIPEE